MIFVIMYKTLRTILVNLRFKDSTDSRCEPIKSQLGVFESVTNTSFKYYIQRQWWNRNLITHLRKNSSEAIFGRFALVSRYLGRGDVIVTVNKW